MDGILSIKFLWGSKIEGGRMGLVSEFAKVSAAIEGDAEMATISKPIARCFRPRIIFSEGIVEVFRMDYELYCCGGSLRARIFCRWHWKPLTQRYFQLGYFRFLMGCLKRMQSCLGRESLGSTY